MSPSFSLIRFSPSITDDSVLACALLSQFKYKAQANTDLTNFRWNKERLLECFLDNPESLLEKSGIYASDINQSKIGVNQSTVECMICFDTFGPSQVFSLPCQHRYCKSCWKEYLEVSIFNDFIPY
jgi:ariadne-1